MTFRSLSLVAFTGVFLSSVALADDAADRVKLAGAWQGESKAVWILESQGDAFHITNSLGDKKVSDFACAPGKKCEVKDMGRKVTVEMYFNGSRLVVIKTRGEEIVKLRFGMAEGDELELEVMPVAPAGKPRRSISSGKAQLSQPTPSKFGIEAAC
jgi:hypothetical protein